MSNEYNWQYDLEEYIKQGEPERAEKSYEKVQSADSVVLKCKNCTLDEMAIISIMKDDPNVTQKKIAELTGKSERWVKTRTVEMQEKGLISRENGKRNGRWVVFID